MSESPIRQAVQQRYGEVARGGLSSDQPGVKAIAQAFGYSHDELTAIPAEANMGLSCGNPTAFASLQPGETVVDLGCGGGLDVFLAAKRVAPNGRAIGIDMTPDMLALARRNAERLPSELAGCVAFHQATIDQMPLDDSSVDCVISNCVINLAPDKPAVLTEIARVLKPGGRVAISDIALLQPLPPEVAEDVMAYVGCISGAVLLDDYRAMLLAAGFASVEVEPTGADLNAYAQGDDGAAGCCGPLSQDCGTPQTVSLTTPGGSPPPHDDASLHERFKDMLSRFDVNEYAVSVRITATMPVEPASR